MTFQTKIQCPLYRAHQAVLRGSSSSLHYETLRQIAFEQPFGLPAFHSTRPGVLRPANPEFKTGSACVSRSIAGFVLVNTSLLD